ncbi:MAG TPA: LytS/YhcK type 5TM receptor domain-containing protein, partial [Methanoregula sp.]|nr:LytS/YhcK type 5TM receptor domain-containing protein [Methanoregula sp.]
KKALPPCDCIIAEPTPALNPSIGQKGLCRLTISFEGEPAHGSLYPAVLFAILMEVFHMLLTLAIARPFDAALAIVSKVYIPMIVANAIGMYVFCVMVENFRHERELQEEHDARTSDRPGK